MKNEHPIDTQFQQALLQKRVAPSPQAWNRLAETLEKQPAHDSIVWRPQLLKIAAAILLLLLVQGTFWNGATQEYTAYHAPYILSESARQDTQLLSIPAENPKRQGQQLQRGTTTLAVITTTKIAAYQGSRSESVPVGQPNNLQREVSPIASKPLALAPSVSVEMMALLVLPKTVEPTADVKVIINLTTEEPVENAEQKSKLGKLWQKIKDLPIGESD